MESIRRLRRGVGCSVHVWCNVEESVCHFFLIHIRLRLDAYGANIGASSPTPTVDEEVDFTAPLIDPCSPPLPLLSGFRRVECIWGFLG